MKLNIDNFWFRTVLMAVLDVLLVIVLYFVVFDKNMDSSIICGTLVSILCSFVLEGIVAHFKERFFSFAELLGAGIFGSIAASFIMYAVYLTI
jgi:hypothetical protein